MGRVVNFPDTAPAKDPNLCFASAKTNIRTSKFVGVRRVPGAKEEDTKWVASIRSDGKKHALGTFLTEVGSVFI